MFQTTNQAALPAKSPGMIRIVPIFSDFFRRAISFTAASCRNKATPRRDSTLRLRLLSTFNGFHHTLYLGATKQHEPWVIFIGFQGWWWLTTGAHVSFTNGIRPIHMESIEAPLSQVCSMASRVVILLGIVKVNKHHSWVRYKRGKRSREENNKFMLPMDQWDGSELKVALESPDFKSSLRIITLLNNFQAIVFFIV